MCSITLLTIALYPLGISLDEQILEKVAEVSKVMEEDDDFLSKEIRDECERVIPLIEDVIPKDAALTYIFLKSHYKDPSTQ